MMTDNVISRLLLLVVAPLLKVLLMKLSLKVSVSCNRFVDIGCGNCGAVLQGFNVLKFFFANESLISYVSLLV